MLGSVCGSVNVGVQEEVNPDGIYDTWVMFILTLSRPMFCHAASVGSVSL